LPITIEDSVQESFFFSIDLLSFIYIILLFFRIYPIKNMKKGSKYKPKIPKKVKFPLDRAYTKILPKVYERMNYTPQEFWLKFTQYLERSDKNSEEICISGFAVYAQTSSDFLNQHRTSKDFSSVVEAIMTCFESRYEQKGIK